MYRYKLTFVDSQGRLVTLRRQGFDSFNSAISDGQDKLQGALSLVDFLVYQEEKGA